jgi:hypothetical protein
VLLGAKKVSGGGGAAGAEVGGEGGAGAGGGGANGCWGVAGCGGGASGDGGVAGWNAIEDEEKDKIQGSFGSQPQFAKPNFGSHKLFGLCLVFVTLVVCHTLLIIWPTCHRVNFLANSCESLASNFLATLCGCHTLLNFVLANYGWEPNRPSDLAKGRDVNLPVFHQVGKFLKRLIIWNGGST